MDDETVYEDCPRCDATGVVWTGYADVVTICPKCDGACAVPHACRFAGPIEPDDSWAQA